MRETWSFFMKNKIQTIKRFVLNIKTVTILLINLNTKEALPKEGSYSIRTKLRYYQRYQRKNSWKLGMPIISSLLSS
jgi:hypothetical protein